MTFTRFPSFNITRRTALWVMLLCALACGLMQYYTPWQLDDLGYGRPCRYAMQGGPASVGWTQGWEWFRMHWNTINGRFGDKLMLWMLGDIPKWGIACIAGLSCLSLFWFASKLAFGSVRRHPARSILLTVLLNCLLPWGAYIFFCSMFLNYGVGSAISSIAVWLFVRNPQQPSGVFRYPLLFLTALMAGWWHEAYCVPMLCGMVVFLLTPGIKLDSSRLVMLAGTLIALALILLAPGFWVRRAMNPVIPESVALLPLAKCMNANILILPLSLMVLLKSSLRHRYSPMQKGAALLACTVLLVTTGIYITSAHEHRVFWYAGTIVIPTICMLCAPLCAGWKRVLKVGCTLAGILLLAIHYPPTILLQRSLNEEYKDITEAYVRSADGSVFYDFHGRSFGPAITLRKARVVSFNYEMRAPLPWFYRDDDVRLALMPTALRDFDMRNFSAPKQTIIYKGNAVSNDTSLLHRHEVIFVDFTLANGRSGLFPTIINRFKAADGTQIFYLEPDERHTEGSPIIKAEIPDATF